MLPVMAMTREPAASDLHCPAGRPGTRPQGQHMFDNCTGRRTVDGLVRVLGQDLRLPRVGLIAQVGPGGVARAGGDAAIHQRLQQEAGH
jgi:hypothetical protein